MVTGKSVENQRFLVPFINNFRPGVHEVEKNHKGSPYGKVVFNFCSHNFKRLLIKWAVKLMNQAVHNLVYFAGNKNHEKLFGNYCICIAIYKVVEIIVYT